MLVLLAACASLVGIEELEKLPESFPIAVEGEQGHVTRSPVGQVAVDLAHPDDETARAAWKRMIASAEAAGFHETDRGVVKKRERVVLEGEGGRLELACCAGRADRRILVLASWWAPGSPALEAR